jgi:uncharacterized small protein (DUF1192 family)
MLLISVTVVFTALFLILLPFSIFCKITENKKLDIARSEELMKREEELKILPNEINSLKERISNLKTEIDRLKNIN